VSPNGSVTVLSDDDLGFADLASPGTIENQRHNPAIGLNVVIHSPAGAWFKGAAQVVKDPEAHERIARVLGPDYPFEQVVFASRQLRKRFRRSTFLTRSSEAEVTRFWLERYGYRLIW
jgi:hypothetical protein